MFNKSELRFVGRLIKRQQKIVICYRLSNRFEREIIVTPKEMERLESIAYSKAMSVSQILRIIHES